MLLVPVVLVYLAVRLGKWIIDLIQSRIKNLYKGSVELYDNHKEEVKEKVKSSIDSSVRVAKSSVKAFKEAIPEQESVTAGRKTIKQMLVRVLVISSLWVISLVVAVVLVASNFNLAMGLY
jgi:hypothetical protein